MHLRRLDVRGDRVGKVAELTDICGGVDIDTLGEVVVRRVRRSKVRWQAPVHLGVDELCALGKQELANVVQRKANFLHRVRDSHSLEVTAVVHLAGLAVDQRVVGGCGATR